MQGYTGDTTGAAAAFVYRPLAGDAERMQHLEESGMEA